MRISLGKTHRAILRVVRRFGIQVTMAGHSGFPWGQWVANQAREIHCATLQVVRPLGMHHATTLGYLVGAKPWGIHHAILRVVRRPGIHHARNEGVP